MQYFIKVKSSLNIHIIIKFLSNINFGKYLWIHIYAFNFFQIIQNIHLILKNLKHGLKWFHVMKFLQSFWKMCISKDILKICRKPHRLSKPQSHQTQLHKICECHTLPQHRRPLLTPKSKTNHTSRDHPQDKNKIQK